MFTAEVNAAKTCSKPTSWSLRQRYISLALCTYANVGSCVDPSLEMETSQPVKHDNCSRPCWLQVLLNSGSKYLLVKHVFGQTG